MQTWLSIGLVIKRTLLRKIGESLSFVIARPRFLYKSQSGFPGNLGERLAHHDRPEKAGFSL
jgi:hypothetical protein